MKIIAHRANLYGPSPETENTPAAIEKVIEHGFDVEIDLHFMYPYFYLGHDKPQYRVYLNQISEWSKSSTIYLHCKTLDGLTRVMSEGVASSSLIPFFHDQDDCILLKSGKIWVHPKVFEDIFWYYHLDKTIAVVNKPVEYKDMEGLYGVCTDYANDFYANMLRFKLAATLDDVMDHEKKIREIANGIA